MVNLLLLVLLMVVVALSQEQNCLAMCMDRYIETMNVVNHSLANRQQS